MPIIVDGFPPTKRLPATRSVGRKYLGAGQRAEAALTIGLVNNMPDPALESTEQQFLTLLHEAAKDLVIRVRLFSIGSIPRGERAREHLRAYYSDPRDLWGGTLDGLIVTGTEPRAADLADEPYWASLTDLFDWAQDNTAGTVLSCLAAHAAVLHLHGIKRVPLSKKCFGVFQQQKHSDHPLLKGCSGRVATPHSRWNELPGAALASAGYDVLTASADAGVDTFVWQGRSQFLFFQGHPEYDLETLRREYRRDVGRFLRHEQARYPDLPAGYFDDATTRSLQTFRVRAEAERRAELLSELPAASISPGNAWRAFAIGVYSNWLTHVAAQREKVAARSFNSLSPAAAAP
jgi:homoserine O-succinyltransferase